MRCPSGCSKCSDAVSCDLCFPGYLSYSDPAFDYKFSCVLETCPPGYLPYLPSLYEHNPELFSRQEIAEKTDVGFRPRLINTTRTDNVIYFGIYGEL